MGEVNISIKIQELYVGVLLGATHSLLWLHLLILWGLRKDGKISNILIKPSIVFLDDYTGAAHLQDSVHSKEVTTFKP